MNRPPRGFKPGSTARFASSNRPIPSRSVPLQTLKFSIVQKQKHKNKKPYAHNPNRTANQTVRRIYCEGPKLEQNRKGEEVPTWRTLVGNEKRQPRGTIYQCLSLKIAEGLARQMSHDRKLELVHEAQPALTA